MRSSTKSESNGNNNSDNMNNNTVDDDRDKGSADDVIEIASSETVSPLHNQSSNCESELIQRADHAITEQEAKVNVYEQVSAIKLQIVRIYFTLFFLTDRSTKRDYRS